MEVMLLALRGEFRPGGSEKWRPLLFEVEAESLGHDGMGIPLLLNSLLEVPSKLA